MDAFDDGVGGKDEIGPVGTGDQRRVVGEAERAGAGERCVEPGDALELIQRRLRARSRDPAAAARAPACRARR
jgi:hypothetical protein